MLGDEVKCFGVMICLGVMIDIMNDDGLGVDVVFLDGLIGCYDVVIGLDGVFL